MCGDTTNAESYACHPRNAAQQHRERLVLGHETASGRGWYRWEMGEGEPNPSSPDNGVWSEALLSRGAVLFSVI